MTTTRALEWLRNNGYTITHYYAAHYDREKRTFYPSSGCFVLVDGEEKKFRDPTHAVNWIKDVLTAQSRANDETPVRTAENAAAGRLESFPGLFD